VIWLAHERGFGADHQRGSGVATLVRVQGTKPPEAESCLAFAQRKKAANLLLSLFLQIQQTTDISDLSYCLSLTENIVG